MAVVTPIVWPRWAEPALSSRDVAPAPGRGDGLIPAPPFANLDLGPVKFHTYGLLVGAAGLVGWQIFKHNLAAANIPTGKLGGIVAGTVVATLIGARLNHVATEPGRYKDRPLDILKIWNGGLGIFGGVGAGALTGALLASRAGLPVALMLDAAVPALLVGQAIGRFGNYFNQELYGKPTDAPWGLQVDPEHRPAEFRDRNSFHPTFLYEAGWNVALAGGLLALGKSWKGRPPGMLFALYVGGYAAGRFAVETLRSDKTNEVGGLRQNQWISLALMGAAGIGALLLHSRFKAPLPL